MDTGNDCSICLEPLMNGDELVKLSPCNHLFHKACVSQIGQHQHTNCPNCRNPFAIIPHNFEGNIISLNTRLPFVCEITTKNCRPRNITKNSKQIVIDEKNNICVSTYTSNYLYIDNDMIRFKFHNTINDILPAVKLKILKKLTQDNLTMYSDSITIIKIEFSSDTFLGIDMYIPRKIDEEKKIFETLEKCLEYHSGNESKITTTTKTYNIPNIFSKVNLREGKSLDEFDI